MANAAQRIILVSCGKSKADGARAARELYTGNLFRAARDYAETSGCRWFVLSGKHHLVEPDQELLPYDEKAPGVSVRMAQWGEQVVAQLREKLGDVELEIEVLGGVLYVTPIRTAVAGLRLPWTILDPLQGLEVGERLSWFKARREERTAKTTTGRIPETCAWKTRRCGVCGAGPDGVSGQPLRCWEHVSHEEVATDLWDEGGNRFERNAERHAEKVAFQKWFDADLNADAPCALCGKPTIRGVNSDFCSEDCEKQSRAADEEDDSWEAILARSLREKKLCKRCGYGHGAHAGTSCPKERPTVRCRACGEEHDGTCINDECWTSMTQDEKERLADRIRVAPGFTPPAGWNRKTLKLVQERDDQVEPPSAQDIEQAAVEAARAELAPREEPEERFELVGGRMPRPRRDPAWLGLQLDLFQRHLAEAP